MAFSRLIQTADAWGSQELGGNYSLGLISILSEMLEYLQSFKLQQIHVPKKKKKLVSASYVVPYWFLESVGNFDTAVIKCRFTSWNRKDPSILRSCLAESIDRRGILSNHIRWGWLAISTLDAANLSDAVPTFSYIPPERNGYRSEGGDVDEIVRLHKGSICISGCLCVCAWSSEGKRWKDTQMSDSVCALHQVVVSVCMCVTATSKINSCLETFGKCLIPAFLSSIFFSPSLRVPL